MNNKIGKMSFTVNAFAFSVILNAEHKIIFFYENLIFMLILDRLCKVKDINPWEQCLAAEL